MRQKRILIPHPENVIVMHGLMPHSSVLPPAARFHVFVYRRGRLIVHCNPHTKRYPSLLLSLCSLPTHIYRRAATDELNLDGAVAKLCLIMLLLFYLSVTLIQLFSSISFCLIIPPRLLCGWFRNSWGGGKGNSAGEVSPSMDLAKD